MKTRDFKNLEVLLQNSRSRFDFPSVKKSKYNNSGNIRSVTTNQSSQQLNFATKLKVLGRLLLVSVGLVFIIFTVLGCSGGGGGVLGAKKPLDQYLENGWYFLRRGQNEEALLEFGKVLNDFPSPPEIKSANTGVAWSYAQINELEKALSYFKLVENTSNDANLGYAGVLISRGQTGDYQKAKSLLENIGLKSLDYSYYSEHKLDVSSAEAHALMAISYYYTGETDRALLHIKRAKSLDQSYGYSPVSKVADALLVDLALE